MKDVGRLGEKNSNWKGGLCSVSNVDDILLLPEHAIQRIEKKLYTFVRCGDGKSCWEWEGAFFQKSGRPRCSVGLKSFIAARVMYVLAKREPVGDLFVCHHCDNIVCLNPHHLFKGTPRDNTHDMIRKGRKFITSGELNGCAKLSEKDVMKIRKLREKGYTLKQIQKKVKKVSYANVCLICRKAAWRHI